ncbi:hypothetical protein B0682_03895 [Moraxella lincolnii]|uniref:Uncharacterized protein n=1 Tax=Lwoffella lincolnii TaxID=90241 RepID=A0A1T0CHE4_9GAMM|nr:hypothetical protein B0682_03895 [Moraxella lincolnii]
MINQSKKDRRKRSKKKTPVPGQSYRDHGGYFNDKWDIKIGGDKFTFMSSLVINKPCLEKMNRLTFRAMGYDLVHMASAKGKSILSYD